MRYLRIALFATMLLLSPGVSVNAETVVPIDLDGETVNFVVPDGDCLLDIERPMERMVYGLLSQMVGTDGEVVALFVGCSELEQFRTDIQSLDHFSRMGAYYYSTEEDGSAKLISTISRARMADMLASATDHIDFESITETYNKKMREVTADPTAKIDLQQFGSTGSSETAAYFAFAAGSTSYGTEYPSIGAIAVTLVHQHIVGLIIVLITSDPAAVRALDSEARELLDASLAANPDSDN